MSGAGALFLAGLLAAAGTPDSVASHPPLQFHLPARNYPGAIALPAGESPRDLPLRARQVVEMRAAEAAGDRKRLGAILAPDSRVWFEARAGEGERRDPAGKDAFADWDRYFHAEKRVTYMGDGGDSVVFRLVETNDFYKLLDRPPSHARLVYWFDGDDRITGTLVQSIPPPSDAPKPTNRMPEFKAWESARDPKLLAWLLPNGRLDPDVAHARRWRTELIAWRRAAGLPEVAIAAP